METFKVWMLSLCGATAITALFRILLNNSSLRKVLNIFFTLFVLFYTIMPFQFSFNSNWGNNTSTDSSIKHNEIYKNGYEQIIKSSIEAVCKESGVEVISFEIYSNMKDDGFLYVEKIEIDINSNDKKDIIKKEIKEKLGYEVIIE